MIEAKGNSFDGGELLRRKGTCEVKRNQLVRFP